MTTRQEAIEQVQILLCESTKLIEIFESDRVIFKSRIEQTLKIKYALAKLAWDLTHKHNDADELTHKTEKVTRINFKALKKKSQRQ